MKIQSSTKKGRVKRVIARTAIMLGICLAAIIVFIYSAMLVICYGPSPRARDLFVNTCMETSFLKYFPPLVLSSSQIEAIQKANSIVDNGEVTVGQQDYTNVENQNTSQPAIEIVDVVGATYKGKMMIVKDPSRVVVGTSSDTFSADKGGKKLDQMIEDEGAIAGVNAGGFVDDGGVGNGGMPIGLVIKNSKLLNGDPEYTGDGGRIRSEKYASCRNHDPVSRHLIRDCGTRSASDRRLSSMESRSRSAVQAADLIPRTAIGQRADGSVLILVIDGRQPHSLGATHKDLVDVMVDFDAVNACNLDGGSSSMMYYQGELQTVCSSL